MKVRLIRNATLVVEYAGKTFLIDPFLAEKGTLPPFPAFTKNEQYNPLVQLPVSLDDLIKDVEAVIVTHLHYDHFDEAAKEVLPKNVKMFVQNEEDAAEIKKAGFQDIEVLSDRTSFEGIQLLKTKGEHGRGEVLHLTGAVCGVVFKHPDEKTLYVAGDTVWYEDVLDEIETHQPEVIVVNGGDVKLAEGGSLIMGKDDIYEVHKAAPNAVIVSVHMEAVNHWTLSRAELKSFLNEKGITSNVFVPDDGESYTF